MDREFRQSPTHLADMSQVVREAKAKYPQATLVLGHSAGTISATSLALALGSEVDALVLMSSMIPILGSTDLARLPAKSLMVHHVKDACPVSLFVDAQKIGPKTPKISVDGPDDERPSTCGARTNHWFGGQEEETLAEVFNWLQGRPFALNIR